MEVVLGSRVDLVPASDLKPGVMQDHLARRYFDTDHAVLQATVDNDLPELENAVKTLAAGLPAEEPTGRIHQPNPRLEDWPAEKAAIAARLG